MMMLLGVESGDQHNDMIHPMGNMNACTKFTLQCILFLLIYMSSSGSTEGLSDKQTVSHTAERVEVLKLYKQGTGSWCRDRIYSQTL